MITITNEEVEESYNELCRKFFLLIKKDGSDLSDFDDRQLKVMFERSIKIEEYEMSKLIKDEIEKRNGNNNRN